MLTGQVFAIMGKVAEDPQIRSIIKSADHYLYEKEIGGYRLNTDFHELKFDLGRMFGFAYGERKTELYSLIWLSCMEMPYIAVAMQRKAGKS